jgi:hypothetical protein
VQVRSWHNCSKQHRTYRVLARCAWKQAEWIKGDGSYAVLAHCRVLTVQLYVTAEEAEAAKAFIDRLGCGGFCAKQHELIKLELTPPDSRNCQTWRV